MTERSAPDENHRTTLKDIAQSAAGVQSVQPASEIQHPVPGLDKMTERSAPDVNHRPTLKDIAQSAAGVQSVHPASQIHDPVAPPQSPTEEIGAGDSATVGKAKEAIQTEVRGKKYIE
jgi:osmotically-inducible protein OsmY